MPIIDKGIEEQLRLFLRLAHLLMPEWEQQQDAFLTLWQTALSPSQKRKAMKAGLCDLLDQSFQLEKAKLLHIESTLSQEGFGSLALLQLQLGKRVQKLLKRHKITQEEDAIILKNMMDADLLSLNDFQHAQALIDAFGRA